VHQIVLESVKQPSESKAFFEYQRNARILISPNDQWIILNNRPERRSQRAAALSARGAGPLDYLLSVAGANIGHGRFTRNTYVRLRNRRHLEGHLLQLSESISFTLPRLIATMPA